MYTVERPDPNIIARECDAKTALNRFNEHSKKYPGDEPIWKKRLSELAKELQSQRVPYYRGIKTAYKLIDDYLKHIRVNDLSLCQKGCSHCCSIDVEITLLEAAYIVSNTNRKIKDHYQPLKKGYHESKDNYCPFHNQGSCNVYEYRPIACRTYHVFDSHRLCAEMNKQITFQTGSSPLIGNIAVMLLYHSDDRYADIREWFNDADE